MRVVLRQNIPELFRLIVQLIQAETEGADRTILFQRIDELMIQVDESDRDK